MLLATDVLRNVHTVLCVHFIELLLHGFCHGLAPFHFHITIRRVHTPEELLILWV